MKQLWELAFNEFIEKQDSKADPILDGLFKHIDSILRDALPGDVYSEYTDLYLKYQYSFAEKEKAFKAGFGWGCRR